MNSRELSEYSVLLGQDCKLSYILSYILILVYRFFLLSYKLSHCRDSLYLCYCFGGLKHFILLIRVLSEVYEHCYSWLKCE